MKEYKIFIASPSDTSEERAICEKVFVEINSGLGGLFEFRIESLKWEKDVRPSIQNKEAQAIINEQIGNSYDIFLGIINKKFGTPTNSAGSGTEEEFNIAFERFKTQSDLEVMVYFNDAPPLSMSELNPKELVKIQEFKSKIQSFGIYGTYNGPLDFEEKLRKNLTKLFIEEYKKKNSEQPAIANNIINKEALRKIFAKRLNDSLKGFDDQPIVWIEPILSRTNEISQNPDENYDQRVHIEEVLHSPFSYIIKAPSQFGLTSLAHHLVKEAWENNEFWLYLDNNNTKPHTIVNAIKNEAESLDQKLTDVKCVVFDSFYSNDKSARKKIKALIEKYHDLRIIILHTIDDSLFLKTEIEDDDNEYDLEVNRDFQALHLLALPRNVVRQVVNQYNQFRRIDEDDKVLAKVVSDLDCLNLHRTPYNCLTLLKVSEKYFDDSPINRTKMIEMILFVLFDMGEVPRYKTKPDLKDCEYILGRFCERMIREEDYEFSKEDFITELKEFCSEKYVAVDVEVVFEVLFRNNVIINRYGQYCFRSTFWIFYFGAKRMHVDNEFRSYIFDSKKYTSIPEIVEFYTGIDRNRDDALSILFEDIKSTKESVARKIGLEGEFNPLGLIKWQPTEDVIEKVQADLNENVKNSKLPDSVKDQYIDKEYNQKKPYNQTIQKIFEEYSLSSLMQKIRAASTALRNSDYASPELKKKLLKEIYESWEELSKVLFVLAPAMASNGTASFEGAAFTLWGNFGETFEERLNKIVQANPCNVVGYFKDDLYSPKLAPLLYESFDNEKNSLIKHNQALLLIFKRPSGWKQQIENYIVNLNKNSFYLYNTVTVLRTKYRYDFATNEELKDMAYLIKMGCAKHEFGEKKPGLNKIVRISDNVLPKREF